MNNSWCIIMGLVGIHNLGGWLAGAKETFGIHCGGGGGCVAEKAGGLSWWEEVSPPWLHPKAHPLPRVIKGVGLGGGCNRPSRPPHPYSGVFPCGVQGYT